MKDNTVVNKKEEEGRMRKTIHGRKRKKDVTNRGKEIKT